MWCRTILTAVAISYVICTLLWSGLQKEDLDANTLEKLGRYNVNIDDMNNEQRRQECLLDHVTTEVQKEALRTSASNDRTENFVSVGIYPETVTLLAASYDNKTIIQNGVKNNKSKSYFDPLPVVTQEDPDLGNETKFEGNKGIIKIEYNIENQPDVESVMNFWTRLTRYTKTIETVSTTSAPDTTTVQVATRIVKNVTKTPNNGYVHSREIEYINRILAEYLASQIMPTTTERFFTREVFPNYVPTKHWEMTKAPIEEESTRPNEKGNNITKINSVTQDDLISSKVDYSSMWDKSKPTPFKVTYDTQILKRIQETSYSQTKPIIRESKTVKTHPTGLLYRLLQIKNDLFNNGVIIPETEYDKLFTNISNEQRENSESFDLVNLFHNISNVYKSTSKNYDQSASAPIKAETWEPVHLRNEKINEEFKASPIGRNDDKIIVNNKPEQMQNFNSNSNQMEFKPPDIKKSILQQNFHIEPKGSRFQAMLPSIKYSKQYKNIETRPEFNKQELNENVTLLSGKKAVISRQPAAIEEFARKFKMKNDTFNADSENISNIRQYSKELDHPQFKKAPKFFNWEPTEDSKTIKSVQEIINNYDRDKEQVIPVYIKGLKSTQNVDSMNISDVQAIRTSIIKEIAENVKRLVLKDIEQDITTTVATASPTISTTAAPITISSTLMTTATLTSEKPSTSLQKEFTQTNHVMQELLKIFKELKAMKDTAKQSTQTQNVTTANNSTTNLPQLHAQPYKQTVVSLNPYLMQDPPIFKASSAQRIAQAPISTGANPRNKTPKYMSQSIKDYHFGAFTIQTNANEIAPLAIQVSEPLLPMNQHIVVTTKRTIVKVHEERQREGLKHIEDKFPIPAEDRDPYRFADKDEFKDRFFYRGKYMDREKPWYNHEYHEKVHNMENTYPFRSRFPELHYPGRLEHIGQPRYLTDSEDQHPRGHKRPGFNEPRNHYGGIRQHQDSYGHSSYDRRPRYEAKFHEKLEGSENWPRSTWKDFHSRSDSSNDEISARQQMPLIKVKERTRYDDSHFAKFLKSQQKVTDMLEKILANNVKNSRPHSVETT